jgi:hypothetical protein
LYDPELELKTFRGPVQDLLFHNQEGVQAGQELDDIIADDFKRMMLSHYVDKRAAKQQESEQVAAERVEDDVANKMRESASYGTWGSADYANNVT